jgi:hypothetical protein
VPTYLSTHIIACLTRQALTRLIETLQEAQEVTLVRASASQLEGRLVCEFEAPDQETLVQFLAVQGVEYEWIFRVELAWGAQGAKPVPGQATAGGTAPEADQENDLPSGDSRPGPPVEDPAEPHGTVASQPALSSFPGLGEAKVLHILRTLKDESAWQLIAAQHETRPVAVLLLHDAVLAPPQMDVPIFACEADVLARGVPSPLPLLTYDQIVELIFACERVTVW